MREDADSGARREFWEKAEHGHKVPSSGSVVPASRIRSLAELWFMYRYEHSWMNLQDRSVKNV